MITGDETSPVHKRGFAFGRGDIVVNGLASLGRQVRPRLGEFLNGSAKVLRDEGPAVGIRLSCRIVGGSGKGLRE